MSEELKPCPFCGGTELYLVHDDGRSWMECRKCHATGPTCWKYDEEDPWNRRAHPAEAEGVGVPVVAYQSRETGEFYEQIYGLDSPLELVLRSDHLAALSAVTAERDRLLHSQQVLMQSRNAHRDERDQLRAELQALRGLVGQCVEYLNLNRQNSIASGSILHRAMAAAVEDK